MITAVKVIICHDQQTFNPMTYLLVQFRNLELVSIQSPAIFCFYFQINKGISLKRSKTNMPLLQAKMLPTWCNSSYKEVKNKPICFRKVCKNQQNIVFFEKKYPRVKFHPGLISVYITSANVHGICKSLINESRNLATL